MQQVQREWGSDQQQGQHTEANHITEFGIAAGQLGQHHRQRDDGTNTATIGAERSISARDRTRRVSTSGSPRCRNHWWTSRMSGTANIVRERGDSSGLGRDGCPVTATGHQCQAQIVDERVEEPGPVVGVADGRALTYMNVNAARNMLV